MPWPEARMRRKARGRSPKKRAPVWNDRSSPSRAAKSLGYCARQEFDLEFRGVHDHTATDLAGPAAVVHPISTLELPPALVMLAAQVAHRQRSVAQSIQA